MKITKKREQTVSEKKKIKKALKSSIISESKGSSPEKPSKPTKKRGASKDPAKDKASKADGGAQKKKVSSKK